nr:NADH dehydrogenase subunit 1 [Scatoglyphus polytrematus]
MVDQKHMVSPFNPTTIFLLDFLISILGLILSVAFFTLVERKVMGLMHYRKGPNKVIIMGLTQPITDAIKLLTKEISKFSFVKILMFIMGPSLMMALMISCWGWFKYTYSMIPSEMMILLILSIMSLSAYGFIMSSWGSNSKYSMLGGYRVVAQVISYEVCLFLFLLTLIFISKTFMPEKLEMMQKGMWFMMFSMPLFISWMMLCMAESNRTPFDMAEGESEIVSGFNIEHSGNLFAFIFISEYGMMIFLSFLTSLFFMGSPNLIKVLMICMIFIWVRCCFPRMRYDKLMMVSWKTLLPYSLVMLTVSCTM